MNLFEKNSIAPSLQSAEFPRLFSPIIFNEFEDRLPLEDG